LYIPDKINLNPDFIISNYLTCIRVVSSRKGEERGWAWVARESTPEPRRTRKNEEKQADRKRYSIGQVVKGERLKKIYII
jgi:hypothetical protein